MKSASTHRTSGLSTEITQHLNAFLAHDSTAPLAHQRANDPRAIRLQARLDFVSSINSPLKSTAGIRLAQKNARAHAPARKLLFRKKRWSPVVGRLS